MKELDTWLYVRGRINVTPRKILEEFSETAVAPLLWSVVDSVVLTESEYDLIKITSYDLDFNHPTRYKEIAHAAWKAGLAEVPAEVPLLVAQSKPLLDTDSYPIHFAMEPIPTTDNLLCYVLIHPPTLGRVGLSTFPRVEDDYTIDPKKSCFSAEVKHFIIPDMRACQGLFFAFSPLLL